MSVMDLEFFVISSAAVVIAGMIGWMINSLAELHRKIGDLQGEIGDLRGEVRGEIGRVEISDLREKWPVSGGRSGGKSPVSEWKSATSGQRSTRN